MPNPTTPDRSTAAAFPRYLTGEVVEADRVEVVDYFGRDEILWPICLTCAELLAARVPGKSPRVAALTQLFAAHLVEKYTSTAGQTPVARGGLPIHQLRRVEDYVAA